MGSRYEAGLALKADRERVTLERTPYPVMGKSQDFNLAQSARLDLNVLGWKIRSVGVTNLTPFFIHFPNNPGAFQWILPGTLGAVIPIAGGQPVRVNSIDIPAG